MCFHRQGFRALAALLTSLLLALPAVAHEPVPAGTVLDWSGARAQLLQQADGLTAAQAGVRRADELAAASRWLRLPEVNAEVRRMHLQKTVEIPSEALGPLQPLVGGAPTVGTQINDWRTRPIVTAVMPLYTGGKIPAAQAAARADQTLARAELAGERGSQQLQLVQAYFGQQLAVRVLDVRTQVLAGMEQHLAQARVLEREGMATVAQRLQAEVARDKAQREQLRSANDLASAQQTLAALLRAGAPVQTASPLFVLSQLPASLQQLGDTARQSHPQVERLQALQDKARAGLAVEQAKLKPQIYLFGKYDFQREDALLTDPDWAFGIGLRYNLVSPSMRPLQVRAARAQLEQASAGLEEARTRVGIGVSQAWHALDSARSQFLLLESAQAQAAENLRLQQLSWREGMATSLDVIDARLSLGAAQVERAQAAYQFTVALAQLLEVAGQLDAFENYRQQADKVLQ